MNSQLQECLPRMPDIASNYEKLCLSCRLSFLSAVLYYDEPYRCSLCEFIALPKYAAKCSVSPLTTWIHNMYIYMYMCIYVSIDYRPTMPLAKYLFNLCSARPNAVNQLPHDAASLCCSGTVYRRHSRGLLDVLQTVHIDVHVSCRIAPGSTDGVYITMLILCPNH